MLTPIDDTKDAAPPPRRGLRRFRRIMTGLLLAGVAAFVLVPMSIIFESSGTMSNREAAGLEAQFVELNGLDVHLETAEYTGDCRCEPPVIILMHGFGASTFSWRDVIQPLSRSGEVIAYDRPAFGFTERPTGWTGVNPYGVQGNLDLLSALIKELAPHREVILVGHSAGGQLAAEFALQYPDQVQRLVLVDPAIYTTGGVPSWMNWIFEVPQVDRLGPFLVQGISSSGEALLRESFYNESLITDEVYVGYRAPLQVAGWEQAFWEFTTAPRETIVAENVRRISQPTLLISGAHDTVVPVADTERLASEIPSSTLVIINQSAHLPQEEQPGVFVYSFEKWLQETS